MALGERSDGQHGTHLAAEIAWCHDAGVLIHCDAVLCDLDGTLVDSEKAVVEAWTRFAVEIDEPPERILQMCHGVRTTEVIESLELDLPVMQTALRIESWIVDAGSTPTPGAVAFLAELPVERWAVVTSSLRPTAMSRFEQTELPTPRLMVTAEDVPDGKPHPGGYLHAAEVLGVDPRQCVVIEDAPAGVEAGLAAGMTVLAVMTTHDARQLRTAHHRVADLRAVEVCADRAGLALTVAD